ncbi:MAG: hypothetical protein ACYDEY_14390 [Acidimicrobiales bacterium]
MAVVALVVSIVSAVVAVASMWDSHRSARSAARSASAAETTAALDQQRRHAEITPHFRVTCQRGNAEVDRLDLRLFLIGPPELERLDTLVVVVRDDHPWRNTATQLAGGPTAEAVAKQIWGPYRFVPGVGPGADPVRGIPGADLTGRTTPTGGMPVGEELRFALEPTQPPPWSHQTQRDWQRELGTKLRLKLECGRIGWEPWPLTCEIDTVDHSNSVEVP